MKRKSLSALKAFSCVVALFMVISFAWFNPTKVKAESETNWWDVFEPVEFTTPSTKSRISAYANIANSAGEIWSRAYLEGDTYIPPKYKWELYTLDNDTGEENYKTITGSCVSNRVLTIPENAKVEKGGYVEVCIIWEFPSVLVRDNNTTPQMLVDDGESGVPLRYLYYAQVYPKENAEIYYSCFPEYRPVESPTEPPTESPTVKPTQAPTKAPVVTPTVTPTEKPTTSTNVEKPTESAKPVEKETQASTEAETMVSTENTPVETPSESATAEVEVETSVEGIHTVKGQLKYKDGTPLADTYIELHSVVKKGRTDANGYYEFTWVESGDHKLTAFNENGDVIGEFSLTVGNNTTAMVVENAFTVDVDAPAKTNNSMTWVLVVAIVVIVVAGVAGFLIYKKKNA